MRGVKKAAISVAAMAVAACSRSENIVAGRYEMMSYRITREALDEGVEISHGPVFEFRDDGRTVAVYDDFEFGCFSDSLYKYRYRDGVLRLKGANGSKEFFCEPYPDSSGYDMFLDERYIQFISVSRDE